MHIRRKGKRKKKKGEFFLLNLASYVEITYGYKSSGLFNYLKLKRGILQLKCFIYIYFLPFFFLFRILRHAIASETLTILSM